MSGNLQVRSVTLQINEKKDSKLLELSNSKLDDIFEFRTKVKKSDDILQHLDMLNQRVNKYSKNFADSTYVSKQADLSIKIKNVIQNATGCEFIYFIAGNDDKLYIIKQLYFCKTTNFCFIKKTDYFLQQFIYISDTNLEHLILFESDESVNSKKVSTIQESDSEEEEK